MIDTNSMWKVTFLYIKGSNNTNTPTAAEILFRANQIHETDSHKVQST